MTTHSEKIFEHICLGQGYEVKHVPTRHTEGLRTADFRVSHRGHSFVAEVEELCANEDDLRQIKEFNANGITSGGGRIGSRARNHIRNAAGQLKPHIAEGVPLLVVLYDNTRTADGAPPFPMRYLEPYHIDAAMYGYLVVHVPLERGAERRPDRHGGGRTLTVAEKTYISAVAVISDYDDASMVFYHNHFATHPLQRTFFDGPRYHHLQKASVNSPSSWISRQ